MAIAEALANDPALASRRHELQANSSALSATRTNRLPRVSITGEVGKSPIDYQYDDESVTDRRENLITTTFTFEGTLSVFSSGLVTNRIQQSQLTLMQSQLVLSSTQESVVHNVIQAYYEVLRSQESLALASSQLQVMYELRARVVENARVDSGQSFQIFRADNRAALTEEEVATQRAAFDQAKARFAAAVGIEPSRVSLPPVPPLQALPGTLEEALEIGRSNSLRLGLGRIQIESSKIGRKIIRSSLGPSVDVVGRRSRSTNAGGTEGTTDNDFRGVTFSLNLSATPALDMRGAAQQIKSAESQYDLTERQVDQNITVAWHEYRSRITRFQAQEKFLDATAQELEVYKKQFENNQRTLIDLVNINHETYNARLRILQGQIDRDLALYGLLNAIGQLESTLASNEG